MSRVIFWSIGIILCVAAGYSTSAVLKSPGAAIESAFKPELFSTMPVDGDDPVAHWINVLEAVPHEEAYAAFKAYNNEQSFNQQHTNAHYFGEAVYKVAGVDGVAVCDSEFAFGCYHSLFGWGLADLGSSIISDFDEACIAAYGPKGLGCQHGIGHGLLADMGAPLLTEALELCATLNWQEPIGGCTSGVFMEYNFNTMWEGPLRSYDETVGWHYPCEVIPDRFKPACYYELPQWWTSVKYDDFVFAGERCQEVTSSNEAVACYRGLGKEAASNSRYDIPTTLGICAAMPDEESELLCIEGATWIMAFEPVRAEDWQTMCDRLDGDARTRCLASKELI